MCTCSLISIVISLCELYSLGIKKFVALLKCSEEVNEVHVFEPEIDGDEGILKNDRLTDQFGRKLDPKNAEKSTPTQASKHGQHKSDLMAMHIGLEFVCFIAKFAFSNKKSVFLTFHFDLSIPLSYG